MSRIRLLRVGAVLAASAIGCGLAACSGRAPERRLESRPGVAPSPRLVHDGRGTPRGGGSYKIGAPYQIGGRWYFPAEDRHYDRTGIASWYGADFHGRKTANGEIFDSRAITAAHPTLPLPSHVYVTNLANGRTLLVRVNDRGPYAGNRMIDLSREAARLLGYEGRGLIEARVVYAGRAPLDGNDDAERRFLAAQPWMRGAPVAGRMALGAD